MIEGKYFEDYAVGNLVISEEFAVSEHDVAAYLKLVGESHPIHWNKEFCKQQFGAPDLLVPGCLTLALADAYWANLVTPASPFSPHYGQDKVRYLGRLLCNEAIHCEFKLVEKLPRNEVYGMLVYETYVKKHNGDAILFEIDKLLVPYRNPPPK